MSLESETDFHWFHWWLSLESICETNNTLSRPSFCSVAPRTISSSVRNFCDGLSVATDSSRGVPNGEKRPAKQRLHGATPRAFRKNIPTRHQKVGEFQPLEVLRPLQIIYIYIKCKGFFLRQVLHGITACLHQFTFTIMVFFVAHQKRWPTSKCFVNGPLTVDGSSTNHACACHRKGFPRPLWIQTWKCRCFMMMEGSGIWFVVVTDAWIYFFKYVLRKDSCAKKWRTNSNFGDVWCCFGCVLHR